MHKLVMTPNRLRHIGVATIALTKQWPVADMRVSVLISLPLSHNRVTLSHGHASVAKGTVRGSKCANRLQYSFVKESILSMYPN